jgi:hypothetical protein
MFPSKYLDTLGIDKATLPTSDAMGVDADHALRFAHVTFETDHLGPVSVYAGFSDNLNGDTYGLLGHMGFLNRFTLRCHPHKHIFELEAING